MQKHPEMSTFIIGNVGRVGFYYKWDLTDKFLEDFATVSIEPKEGYIKTNCEVQSVISITAVKFLSKKNIKLELNVRKLTNFLKNIKILIFRFLMVQLFLLH